MERHMPSPKRHPVLDVHLSLVTEHLRGKGSVTLAALRKGLRWRSSGVPDLIVVIRVLVERGQVVITEPYHIPCVLCLKEEIDGNDQPQKDPLSSLPAQ
jgi:hypothetical protein